jgi:type II secretory pathway component PulL
MAKPRRWRKDPYYKVQVFNETFQSWKDERGAFDDLEQARTYIARQVAPARARIMEVRRESRQVIDEV